MRVSVDSGYFPHIKGFRSALFLGYNAPQYDSFLPAFRDNLSVPSSRVKQSDLDRAGSMKSRIEDFHDRIIQDGVQVTWH